MPRRRADYPHLHTAGQSIRETQGLNGTTDKTLKEFREETHLQQQHEER